MHARFRGRLAVGLLVLSACAEPTPPAPASDPATARSLASGEVVGFVGAHESHVWLGIPYAAPPIGELRWRAPRDPQRWEGTREALAFGARCPQRASELDSSAEPGSVVGDEDCLTLNVWAPPDAGASRLPVMLWIHGGGNVQGGADFFDGAALAVRQNVVVVTANYRLGPLGFLRHAALREGATDEERSGNFALLDLVQALRWVRANAAAFGGDPENVTIFGESAGARNVLALLQVRAAEGLFHAAISQSGGTRTSGLPEAEMFTTEPARARGQAASSGDLLVHLLITDGAADVDDARGRLAGMRTADVATFLRGQSPAAIVGAYPSEAETGLYAVPQMFRDGVVLPEVDAMEAIKAGRYARVPVILGTNRDEAKLFMLASREHASRWFGVPRLRDPDAYEREARYRSRFWKAYGADEPAAAMRRVQGPSVFVYRFDWDEEPSILGADLGKMLGAAHVIEVPFVFAHWQFGPNTRLLFDESNAAGREALSDAMQSYWGEFAWTGAPGRGRGGALPAWPAWDPSAQSADKYIVFDTEAGGGIRTAHEVESSEALVAQLASDSSYDAAGRCAVFEEWVRSQPPIASRAAMVGCAAPTVASGD